ncbi:DKNYY domain-containing protein [uncultured Aquimarina sp.]|uniref:DKNYY domain-containing protein n=1 Tax=uncultured Aquimarina sp. TaxID=575652 RepID=UPI0026238651|nr:DKNYY domain-containing protein [uncultured Aquimarina sp.]
MNDIIIVDIFWNKRLVQDKSGKEFEIFRGKDYDLDWQHLGSGYSKDSKRIYHWTKECFRKQLKGIDILSFELIQANESENTVYFKDKHAVYLDSYMSSCVVLEEADPEKFQIIDIDKGYASSGDIDYWYYAKLPYALTDLTRINRSYQKVRNSIYFGHTDKLICDVESFEIINHRVETVAKDNNHVYYKSEIIEGANPKTFQFLEECIRENSSYYLECDIHFYAKDDKYAYFINVPFGYKIIKTKDLANFRFVIKDEIGYGIDSKYIYEKGRRKKIE